MKKFALLHEGCYFDGGDRCWLSVLSFISSALGRFLSHLRDGYLDQDVLGPRGQLLLLMVVITLLSNSDGGFLK